MYFKSGQRFARVVAASTTLSVSFAAALFFTATTVRVSAFVGGVRNAVSYFRQIPFSEIQNPLFAGRIGPVSEAIANALAIVTDLHGSPTPGVVARHRG